jgi:hypothetical protein
LNFEGAPGKFKRNFSDVFNPLPIQPNRTVDFAGAKLGCGNHKIKPGEVMGVGAEAGPVWVFQ